MQSVTQVQFANYYAAKFQREKKPRPSDWLIIQTRSGFELVKLKRS